MGDKKTGGRVARLMGGAAEMPPLTHRHAGADFDVLESEVCAWLVTMPGARQIVFDAVRNAGLIVYDRESNTWRGKSWGR